MKIGVVAHFSRSKQYAWLRREVGADYCGIDYGDIGSTDNHRRVWRHMKHIVAQDEWAVVLEDDAMPVKRFRQHAQAALDCAPAEVVSFYLGRLRPPQWQERISQALAVAKHSGASWILSDAMIHAVAVAICGPEMIDRMLIGTSVQGSWPHDQAMTYWLRRYSHEVAYTVPSLVNHGDLPTVIEHPDGDGREIGRVAWDFGTRETWNRSCIVL